METGPLIALRSFVERAHRSPWSPHSVSAAHEVSLWGKIRLGGFLWLRRCSLSLLPGWVSIGLQVHTLARRPPVAPTNCSIHSSAGDGRRPLIGYQRRLGNFPTASACWQPASHSSSPPGHTRGRRGEEGGGQSRTESPLGRCQSFSKDPLFVWRWITTRSLWHWVAAAQSLVSREQGQGDGARGRRELYRDLMN